MIVFILPILLITFVPPNKQHSFHNYLHELALQNNFRDFDQIENETEPFDINTCVLLYIRHLYSYFIFTAVLLCE